MTTRQPANSEWGASKAARVAVAAVGLTTATLVLLSASIVENGVWLLIGAGVALAATSVGAAEYPTPARLSSMVASLAAIPIMVQII